MADEEKGSSMRRIVSLWKGVIAKGQPTDTDRAPLPADSAPIHPLMYLPVPWVFVLVYLAGVGIQFALPLPVRSAPLLLASRIAGATLLCCGAALAAWCVGLFRAARTTTVPGEASHQLVTSGPYRFSRNPMYVSLTLAYLGEAGILAQAWPLLLLPLILLYLSRIVIPVEEARLREVFGDAYERYCAQVRRWL
jgi:protein-S-isoprenylcysteine O-methyltransferase Ste14